MARLFLVHPRPSQARLSLRASKAEIMATIKAVLVEEPLKLNLASTANHSRAST